MILNKSAVDRGLAHGTLFKTEGLDLREDKGKTMVSTQIYSLHCTPDPHIRMTMFYYCSLPCAFCNYDPLRPFEAEHCLLRWWIISLMTIWGSQESMRSLL